MSKDRVLNWENYYAEIDKILSNVIKTQGENIEKAADILAECTVNGGIIRVFGVGHSHIMAEEVFWRAATLANVQAILEPSMTGHTEMTKSAYMEKIEGTGGIILDYHRVKSPDVMIIVSNSGNNGVPIDVAKEAKERGIKVIVITSVEYTNYLEPLHSSKQKLKDFADVVLDNCCPIGDGALKLESFEQKVGPTSTMAGILLINSLLVETTGKLIEKGHKPDIYFNGSLAANSEDVEKHNQRLIDKYHTKIRNL